MSTAYSVVVLDSLAYVIDNYYGLRVVSVVDPQHPVQVGSFRVSGRAYCVAVSGGRAFVGDDYGVYVLDVTDPGNPTRLGYFSTHEPHEVAAAGNYVYVTTSEGLRIVDVTNPSSPREVGFLPTEYYAYGVAVSNGYVYLASHGLRVVDVTVPENPIEVGYYPVARTNEDVFLSAGRVHLACWDAGLQIVEFYGGVGVEGAPGAQLRASKSLPTIARGVLHLRPSPFPLPVGEGQGVRGRSLLLDISGRKVLDLQPGANDVSRLAPGVYFVCSGPSAVSRQPTAVQKVVVTR
jgi:hypothetical protein